MVYAPPAKRHSDSSTEAHGHFSLMQECKWYSWPSKSLEVVLDLCPRFFNPALNVKRSLFSERFEMFSPDEHVFCAPKECRKTSYMTIYQWHLMRFCCFENPSKGLLFRHFCCIIFCEKMSCEIVPQVMFWSKLRQGSPWAYLLESSGEDWLDLLLRSCCARTLDKSYNDFMRFACKTRLQH